MIFFNYIPFLKFVFASGQVQCQQKRGQSKFDGFCCTAFVLDFEQVFVHWAIIEIQIKVHGQNNNSGKC